MTAAKNMVPAAAFTRASRNRGNVAAVTTFVVSEGMRSPLKRQEAIELLRQHEAELRRAGVRHLYLFGSVARGEAREGSDVDLFFDYEKGKFGLFDLIGVKELASKILDRAADVMTRDSVHPVLRSRIEAEAMQVY